MKTPKFTKHDSDKPQWSLLNWKFISGIVSVLTIGAVKYSRDNWHNCDDINRYRDATMRHLSAYFDGERLDPETGQSHLYHAACNLMFMDYFDNRDSK